MVYIRNCRLPYCEIKSSVSTLETKLLQLRCGAEMEASLEMKDKIVQFVQVIIPEIALIISATSRLFMNVIFVLPTKYSNYICVCFFGYLSLELQEGIKSNHSHDGVYG